MAMLVITRCYLQIFPEGSDRLPWIKTAALVETAWVYWWSEGMDGYTNIDISWCIVMGIYGDNMG